MKLYSIKRRLIASVLLVELISALAITSLALVYERHARFHAFDIMLRGRADSLLGAVQDAEDDQDNVILDGTEASLPRTDLYAVWDSSSHLVGHSANWPNPNRTLIPPGDTQRRRLILNDQHYRVIRVDGHRVVDPDEHGGGVLHGITILYGSPVNPIWHEIWSAVEFYAATSLTLLLVTGFIMFWLLQHGLAPLDDLAAQAARVSVVAWDFTPSEEIRSTAELAPLAAAFEQLLHGLERSFEQQRQFVSDAAHELKTSVAVLKSSLQLLLLKPRTATEYQAGVERCQLDVERLESMVSKMLVLARVEADQSLSAGEASTLPPADLSATLTLLREQFSAMAEIRKIDLRLSAPESLTVALDAERLELLCSNLILNALQHSHTGGRVEIVAELAPADGNESSQRVAALRIRDYGTGIDPARLPHIFDRFYRGDPSRSRNTGGTGLGLAIVKAVVQAVDGTIEITSSPGEGTTVLVHLPLAEQSAASLL